MTKIDEHLSCELPNDRGVPQGSVLGPLLFIIYINDIVNSIKNSKINLFADDTLLYYSDHNVDNAIIKINEDLNELQKWLQENNLSLNIKKTKAMIINKRNLTNIKNNIIFNGEKIDIVSEIKYLGVMLDEKLNFEPHTKYILNKITKKYHILRRINRKTTAHSQILLYNSLISPHFDYCSTVLFLLNKNQKGKLQKMQNKIMRLILKMKFDTSIKFMLNCLQWLSVEQRIKFNTLKFIWKMENGHLPEYMCNKLTKRSESQAYNLRNNDEFNTTNHKKKSSQNSLFYKGVNLYNSFKRQFKSNSNFYEFKRNCIKFVKMT